MARGGRCRRVQARWAWLCCMCCLQLFRFSHAQGIGLTLRRRQAAGDAPLERRGRRLTSTSGAFQLLGSIIELEYFFVTVKLGTPPQQFELIVDTGSTMTYVPCHNCGDQCGAHKNNPYDPSLSSTHETIPCNSERCACGDPNCSCKDGLCTYQRNYAEMSMTQGFLVEDMLWMNGGTEDGEDGSPKKSGVQAVQFVFGCTTKETGAIFKQRADGLLGLGRSNSSIINQLVAHNMMEDSFSLCMGSWDGEGALLLGDVPLPGSLGQMDWVPLQPTEGNFYLIKLDNIGLQEKPLDMPRGVFEMGYGVVLDSGTTFTHLPTGAYKVLVAAVDEHAKKKGLMRVEGPDPQFAKIDICWGGLPPTPDSRQLLRHFPAMQLYIAGGVTLHLGPLNYLFLHSKMAGAYCLGVFDNLSEGTLLGGITLRNLLVKYDRQNRRVGFAHAPCRKLGKLFSDECQEHPDDRTCARDFENYLNDSRSRRQPY